MTAAPTEFAALKQQILASLDAYQSALEQDGLSTPQMIKPELGPLDDPSHLPSWQLTNARDTLLGSLHQMQALVAHPGERLLKLSFSHHTSAALSLVVESRVADALVAAGPDGMSLADLGRAVGVAQLPLVTAMRLLANDHVFTQVSEDRWANNRASLLLVDRSHVWHYIRHQTWFSLRHSAYISDVWRDPRKSASTAPADTAAAVAYDFHGNGYETTWDMLKAAPGGRLESFGRAMGAVAQFSLPGVLQDYPWKESVPAGGTIVDVGGGEGHVLLPLLKLNDSWNGVIQDRPEVLPNAKANMQQQLGTGADRVSYVEIDFLKEAPVKSADVYLMRFIMHDWPDAECIKILQNIRQSMKPESKIIILDSLIIPPVQSTRSATSKTSAPWPLLQSRGPANDYTLKLSMEMLSALNAHERSESQFRSLVERAGLRCTKVYQCRSHLAAIEVQM